jgi:hypothetical protein
MAIENINEIEKSLGLEEGKLSEMITSEDAHTVDLTGRVFLSEEDLSTRISNERKEAGKASVEIAVKKARNELGLEFEGKTMSNLMGAYKDNIESGFNSDSSEREKKLKSDLEAVQNNFTNLQADFEGFKTQVSHKETQRQLDNKILSSMPNDLSIPKEDALLLFKSKHKLETLEGGEMQISDLSGNVFQDDQTKSNLGISDVLSGFVEPYKVSEKQTPKGRGEGNKHKQYSAGSLEAFDKEMTDAGISGVKYNEEMSRRITNGTLKI